MTSLKSLLNLEEGRSQTKAGAGLDKLWLGTTNQPNTNNNNSTNSSSSFSSWFNLTSSSNTNNTSNSNPDISANNTKSWFSFDNPLASSSAKTEENWLALNWYQRMGLFGLSFLGGVIMLVLAFMYLPQILLGQTSKFAMSYTLANILLLLSSAFLVGPRTQFESMFHSSRITISIVYVISLLAVMYSAWQIRSMFVLIPLLIVQFLSLLSYVLSYFPYGASMVKRFLSFFGRKVGLPI
jgi:hypothetical protein